MNDIVVCVRTRDEANRVGRFCESYKDASKILVADGGSEDNTVEIAKTFSNVEVREFTERVQLANGYWRNNDSSHANFLFDWAKEYNPSWIVYDDCDCVMNYLLRQNYRSIFEQTDCDFVMAVRLYIWGSVGQHFPNMAKPGVNHDQWEASLWAWRRDIDFKTVDVPPAYTFRIGDKDVKDLHFDAKTLDIMPPMCLLHYSWDDEQRVEQKIKVYRESGLIAGMLHPLEFAGPLEDLPDFARENE